jgi:hypothetical protein
MFALAYLKHVFWRPCLIFSSSRAHVGMTTSFLRKGMFNIDGLDISESFLASCFFHPYTCTIVAAWNISFINCSTSTFPINMWDVRLLKHSPPPRVSHSIHYASAQVDAFFLYTYTVIVVDRCKELHGRTIRRIIVSDTTIGLWEGLGKPLDYLIYKVLNFHIFKQCNLTLANDSENTWLL